MQLARLFLGVCGIVFAGNVLADFVVEPVKIVTESYDAEIVPRALIRKSEGSFYYVTLHITNKVANDLVFELRDIDIRSNDTTEFRLYADSKGPPGTVYVVPSRSNGRLKFYLYLNTTKKDLRFKLEDVNLRPRGEIRKKNRFNSDSPMRNFVILDE